jgi:hypothetical protein
MSPLLAVLPSFIERQSKMDSREASEKTGDVIVEAGHVGSHPHLAAKNRLEVSHKTLSQEQVLI